MKRFTWLIAVVGAFSAFTLAGCESTRAKPYGLADEDGRQTASQRVADLAHFDKTGGRHYVGPPR